MSSFMVEILFPERTLYWGRASSLTVYAVDGSLTILPGHAPYANLLAPGEIRLHTEEKTCLHFSHAGGVIEVARDKTSVLVYPPEKEGRKPEAN